MKKTYFSTYLILHILDKYVFTDLFFILIFVNPFFKISSNILHLKINLTNIYLCIILYNKVFFFKLLTKDIEIEFFSIRNSF